MKNSKAELLNSTESKKYTKCMGKECSDIDLGDFAFVADIALDIENII